MENYKNPALTATERTEDLLARMTLSEKIAQLQCMMVIGKPEDMASRFPDGLGSAVAFSAARDPMAVAENNQNVVHHLSNQRLGIPALVHVEAVTGVVSPGGTTFPSAIGLGATFNPDTIHDMADTIRRQMLAVGYRHALSPVMDVSRDPRWGRIGETYGEDPALCAAMSVAFTQGLQGESLQDGAIATGKHFLGYGFSDGGLNMASNPITERELREVYAKPFQAAISEAGLAGVMNSYGTLDGEMIIGSKKIMTDLLRGEMGFSGMLVSDYMSIERLVNYKILPDMDGAGIAALLAGLDAEYPLVHCYGANLADAVNNGELDIAVIDRSVRRILEAKFMLGLFDDATARLSIMAEAYGDPVHRDRALKAARESIVLLKNDGILPLGKDIKNIAVIGPHADSIRLLFGCYTLTAGIESQMTGSMAGDMAGMEGMEDIIELDGLEDFQSGGETAAGPETYPGSDVWREREDVRAALQMAYGATTPTILACISEKCPQANIIHATGCDIAGNDEAGFAEAIAAAKATDVVILTLGGKYGWGSNCTIGEGLDRSDIGLPGIQEELAKAVIETGTATIVVHMDARPLSSEYIQENAAAICENWFPGSTGGQAIADVLFGDYNPAGRMPVTAARNAGQIPIYHSQKNGNSYYAKGTVGALNRYVEGRTEPLYYFGEGLSYTDFHYENLSVTPRVDAGSEVTVRFDVTNCGTRDGEEVAQLYVADEYASMLRPAKEFAGCRRLFLRAGERARVTFHVRADQFAFLDGGMDWLVEKGRFLVMVGASSEDIRLRGSYDVNETRVVDGRKRGFYARSTLG